MGIAQGKGEAVGGAPSKGPRRRDLGGDRHGEGLAVGGALLTCPGGRFAAPPLREAMFQPEEVPGRCRASNEAFPPKEKG